MSTADQPLKLGVAGVGTLSVRAIIPHLSCADVADEVVITALCDPIVERAKAVSNQYGIAEVHDSYDALLESDVDAITIVSPIGLHFEQCRAAILAGKHVHLNKTMTTTVAEADELISLAEERGVVIVPSPGEVLRPQVQRARELIESGAIGQVAWAITGCAFETYHENEPERTETAGGAIDPSWYFRAPGGGPMYDMTSYSLHQLTSILGPATSVTALSGQRVQNRTFMDKKVRGEVDDNTILLLDFGSATYAVVYGAAAGSTSDQFGASKFFGTTGTIEGVLLNGEPFDFDKRDETLDEPITDWDAQMRVLPHVVGEHRSIPESHVFQDIMELVTSVRTGTKSAVTAEHARHVIDIIESGYRSAETGQRQQLTTTLDRKVSA
jgi:predicted dehydrogenase